MTRYSIVSQRSRVAVEVKSTLQRLEVVSAQLAGEIEADVQDGRIVPASVKASFSLPAISLLSGNWLVDRDVRVVLETRKYPEISGEVVEVKAADGSGNYWVRGNLRLHGAVREVQGCASLAETSDHHVVFEASTTLDYTLFNLAPPKLLMLRVEPEVQLSGRVFAERVS
jgi:polyisoprenoid-binding protein YceI